MDAASDLMLKGPMHAMMMFLSPICCSMRCNFVWINKKKNKKNNKLMMSYRTILLFTRYNAVDKCTKFNILMIKIYFRFSLLTFRQAICFGLRKTLGSSLIFSNKSSGRDY